MEKPGNFFVIARMWEKQSGSASLLRFHGGQFSVSVCINLVSP